MQERALFYWNQLVSIEIPATISSEDVKVINERLDKLYQDIIFDLKEAQHRQKTLQRKIDTIIKTTVIGSNKEERTANSIMAVLCYISEDSDEKNSINLYELEDEVAWEVDFLESILDAIKFKASCLLTDIAALKLEAQIQN